MIIKRKDLTDILFLDIETVSEQSVLEEVRPELANVWKHKSKRFYQEDDERSEDEFAADHYVDRAGIFAEFSKIVCISVGYLKKNGKSYTLRVKSFASHDEKELLEEFCQLMDRHFDNPSKHYLCGHNIQEFDIPFICRRLVINNMDLPRLLNISGKKPWQVAHIYDTMVMWRFGDYKNYTSLSLLTAALKIPSPKDDISGSEVGSVYWHDNDLERIVTYCEKDVVAVVQIALRYAGCDLLEEEDIELQS